ncbi:hypothetical protein ACFLIM_47035 [Nonomuraea sp. M3C6]|uniref:Uncharacterized protein n=1 Tax=Nonomuraea marmarensis TaxID=3351344 RepID=A0ABW7AUJ7_9ACTN
MRDYLAVLDREEWCQTVRANLDRADDFYAWFADNVAALLRREPSRVRRREPQRTGAVGCECGTVGRSGS